MNVKKYLKKQAKKDCGLTDRDREFLEELQSAVKEKAKPNKNWWKIAAPALVCALACAVILPVALSGNGDDNLNLPTLQTDSPNAASNGTNSGASDDPTADSSDSLDGSASDRITALQYFTIGNLAEYMSENNLSASTYGSGELEEGENGAYVDSDGEVACLVQTGSVTVSETKVDLTMYACFNEEYMSEYLPEEDFSSLPETAKTNETQVAYVVETEGETQNVRASFDFKIKYCMLLTFDAGAQSKNILTECVNLLIL